MFFALGTRKKMLCFEKAQFCVKLWNYEFQDIPEQLALGFSLVKF